MKEVYKDTGLLTGTHGGSSGAAALYDEDVHFDITYAIGRLLENVTQGTSAVVTSHTRNTCTAPGVSWNSGDSYILYVGATKNAVISSTEVCRRSGFDTPFWKLGPDGIDPKNADEDRHKMDGQRARRTKLRR